MRAPQGFKHHNHNAEATGVEKGGASAQTMVQPSFSHLQHRALISPPDCLSNKKCNGSIHAFFLQGLSWSLGLTVCATSTAPVAICRNNVSAVLMTPFSSMSCPA